MNDCSRTCANYVPKKPESPFPGTLRTADLARGMLVEVGIVTIFFTGDQHFKHKKILGYARRPFETVQEGDAEMIRRWNEKVKDYKDTVYHLGDFTLGGIGVAKRYFEQLNGRIKVLAYPWHHDKRWLDPVADGTVKCCSASGWAVELLPPMVVLELAQYKRGKYPQILVLCHYPISRWDRRHYGAWNLFSHSHGRHRPDGLSFDVGVDAQGFAPMSLEEVAARMYEIEKREGLTFA